MAAAGRSVFATVGTTQFDALTSTLLSDEVLSLLASQSYDRLVLQIGRGAEPQIPASSPVKVEWCVAVLLNRAALLGCLMANSVRSASRS